MVQPIKKHDDPHTFTPTLRLHPAPPADVAAEESVLDWRLNENRLEVAPAAELPRMCTQCGDTVDLVSLKTYPGQVQYHVCREHVVAAVAKLAMGLALMAIGGWCLLGALAARSASDSLIFSMLFAGGTALSYFSIPLRAGRLKDGRHALSRQHADVIAEFQRIHR